MVFARSLVAYDIDWRMATDKKLKCQSCECAIDKYEAHFVDEQSFAFASQWPANISLGSYCNLCFDEKVAAELENYNEKMQLAKNINMFYLTQSKESRFVRRFEKPVHVEDCDDREETILRLAFKAVEIGKNALVDVDVSSTKVINGKWQSSRWSGRAVPANINEKNLSRRFPD